MPYPADRERDRPWVMRTYAGHSSATASNALYRRNLAKGQTGLSVAFDLPTQTGYDPDHELARGEVGKVGVPVSHIGDMRALFDGIPMAEANTSMTINATAMWLLALYMAVAQERGASLDRLAGTTQNDIVKEYLSRGTYVFPPAPSLRLITDTVAWAVANAPRWNPINICSYHLQEAGADPVQEVAYALCTATAVLDAVRDGGQVPPEDFHRVVARMSFFVNAGLRFVEELCKMRAFAALWDELCLRRYGISEPVQRRFRYGVQVNSLGLTEAQPENNVQRIVLEMLAVTLSRDARARAVQLPAWNEALGLPRPWDQQWALRMQQVLAYETDLLEYEDIFDGSQVIQAKVDEIMAGARDEIDRVQAMGGAVAAVESGYMKSQLVSSLARRRRRIEAGEEVVVGVNRFEATEPSPLQAEGARAIEVVPPSVEKAAAEAVRRWRAERDQAAVDAALGTLRDAAKTDANLMDATLVCAKAGVTTGEWTQALREVFGEYRAPTGVSGASAAGGAPSDEVAASGGAASGAAAVGAAAVGGVAAGGAPAGGASAGGVAAGGASAGVAPAGVASAGGVAAGGASAGGAARAVAAVRDRVRATGEELGFRLRMLVGKPGLDGHSNGAEQIAVRARDVGFEVVYQGIRLTPAQIVAAAVQEGVHVVGLSVLSGSHLEVVPAVVDGLREAGAEDVPVVVGGIIPPGDAEALRNRGVAKVFTPKDFELTRIMDEIIGVVRAAHGL